MSSFPNGFCYREDDVCEHCAHAEFHGDEAGQTYMSCTLNDDFMIDRYQRRGCRDFKDIKDE